LRRLAAFCAALAPAFLALGACGVTPQAPEGRAGPLRVVSINPCVDAVLVRVADPGQIAGISHYSQDPRATSMSLAVAARFVATSGTAEEVAALRPDVVLAGAHVSPSTVAALGRLGIKLVKFGVPGSIAESNAQVRAIAGVVGHEARGEALVAATEAAVRGARVSGEAVPALIWQGGGLVPGAGTLPDELLRVSGFRNVSADFGLKSWDVLGLEYLAADPPRVLFGDEADRMMAHPVVAKLRPGVAVRGFSERLMHCGGPTIIEALARLSAVRKSL